MFDTHTGSKMVLGPRRLIWVLNRDRSVDFGNSCMINYTSDITPNKFTIFIKDSYQILTHKNASIIEQNADEQSPSNI